MSDDDDTADPGTQRVDKWLWFTRMVKSRTLAAGLVSEGKVRLNRARIEKPSQAVRIGDVVTATIHRQVRVLRVVALGVRRGPPTEARTLYEDLTEPPASGDAAPALARPGVGIGGRRPNKLERRQLAALKRSSQEE